MAVITGMSDGYLYFVGQNQGEAEQRIPMQNGHAITTTAASNWLGQPGSALGWIHTGQTHSNAAMTCDRSPCFHPHTGLEEAYYRGATGNLRETYFANGNKHTQDLGVSMSAS